MKLYFGVPFCEPNSPEWNAAWRKLAFHDINSGLNNPTEAYNWDCGERWQHMGVTMIDGKLFHQFRHRMHPTTMQREYLNIPA